MKAPLPDALWLKAYLLVVAWYLANLFLGTLATYHLFSPLAEEWQHGGLLFLFYAGYIAAVWGWAGLFWARPVWMQALAQLLGMAAGFVAVSWVSYELSVYFDNRTADSFGMYLLASHSGTKVSGKMDAFRIYNEYVALLFIAYAIRYARNLKLREQEKRDLLVQNSDMQLHLLRSQINPHFLFNTLNSISMLVGVDKGRARKAISQLSDILRYALETGGYETVRLSDELLFIENYLDIQLERFDRSFSFRKELPPEWTHLRLPPMVLQPLVENAVKYGVGQRESGGVIVLRVEQQGKGIYVEVADNGPGVAAHTGESTGIGLKNTDLRLRRLYGPEAALQVSASPEGFRVGFWLPVAS